MNIHVIIKQLARKYEELLLSDDYQLEKGSPGFDSLIDAIYQLNRALDGLRAYRNCMRKFKEEREGFK